MKKLTRILYFLIGSLFPIFIGALHTVVHFADLTTPQVKILLNKSIPIMGENQVMWNTWGLMSFMMGISFIILGLLNLDTLYKHRQNYPSTRGIIVMIAYLGCVLYASITYQATPQFYGGILGMLMAVVCLVLTLKGQPKSNAVIPQ